MVDNLSDVPLTDNISVEFTEPVRFSSVEVSIDPPVSRLISAGTSLGSQATFLHPLTHLSGSNLHLCG